MDTHENGTAFGEIAFDERQMLAALHRCLIDIEIEGAGSRLDGRLRNALHNAVVLEAIGDQIFDGADLEPVNFCKAREVGHARHRAVFVHDLADDGRWVEPSELCEIDRRFGVTSTNEHAAFAGDQRKDMTWRYDVGCTLR